MQNKLLLLVATAFAGAFAQRACGTPDPTEAQIAMSKLFQAREKEARIAGNFSAATQSITVNTYIHVVASAKTTAGGYLTVSKVTYIFIGIILEVI